MKLRLAVATGGAALLAVAPAAAATTAGATGPNGTGPTGTASAAAPARAELPMPVRAAAFPVSVDGAVLTYRGTEVTLDLQGRATLAMGGPEAATKGARADVRASLLLTGEHPELGTVTVAARSTAGSEAAVNSPTDPFPARLHVAADMSVTVEGPRSSMRNLVVAPSPLNTREPATLHGTMDRFPPHGALYRLQNPVEFVAPEHPKQAAATIESFPVQVGALTTG